MMALPSIIDPFSKLEDEIAGATANEIAANLAESVQLSRRWRLPLLHRAPDLASIFRGETLSAAAKAALRAAAKAFQSTKR
jgi:hypothetical protein